MCKPAYLRGNPDQLADLLSSASTAVFASCRQSQLTKYTRKGHWHAGYLMQLHRRLLSPFPAGACCCRSETGNGHFWSTSGVCHRWSCLQVGLDTPQCLCLHGAMLCRPS